MPHIYDNLNYVSQIDIRALYLLILLFGDTTILSVKGDKTPQWWRSMINLLSCINQLWSSIIPIMELHDDSLWLYKFITYISFYRMLIQILFRNNR